MTLHYGIRSSHAEFFQLWKQDKSRVPRLFVTNDVTLTLASQTRFEMRRQYLMARKSFFLSRDPRSVIASLYYRRSRRGYVDSNYYWGTHQDFIREGEGGLKLCLPTMQVGHLQNELRYIISAMRDLHSNLTKELR